MALIGVSFSAFVLCSKLLVRSLWMAIISSPACLKLTIISLTHGKSFCRDILLILIREISFYIEEKNPETIYERMAAILKSCTVTANSLFTFRDSRGFSRVDCIYNSLMLCYTLENVTLISIV